MTDRRYKLNDCGMHYSLAGGECQKCAYFKKLERDRQYRLGKQYSGTPWSSVVGDRVRGGVR